MGTARQWDVFCKVIDNWGDLGVCWRLSADLARRGERVRLWVDQPELLAWLAGQEFELVQVLMWNADSATVLSGLPPSDVVIEAFGCPLDDALLHTLAGQKPRWINLEYLSAEPYVARQHGLLSPVLHGPGRGMTKHFYFPGFTPDTGGLLREPGLEQWQQEFDRADWLKSAGVDTCDTRVVSLFCYEPGPLRLLLTHLAADPAPTTLLVTAGRSRSAVEALLPGLDGAHPCGVDHWTFGSLRVCFLPLLSQSSYDHLLWASDLNFVRGEDSVVRAIWAGKPFVWNIYPQDDDAHVPKLEAFLGIMGAGTSLKEAHRAWNGVAGFDWPELDLQAWAQEAQAMRARALAGSDLVTRLFRFLEKTG